jgi:hypothetical protein
MLNMPQVCAFVIYAVVYFGIVSAPAVAGEEHDWVGLYQGLDALDGSIDNMSIMRTGDGEFHIRIVPSRISLCESGVGWIVGDGRLADGVMVRHNSLLFCEGHEPEPLVDVEIVRDDLTGVLSNRTEDDQRILYYHPVGGI